MIAQCPSNPSSKPCRSNLKEFPVHWNIRRNSIQKSSPERGVSGVPVGIYIYIDTYMTTLRVVVGRGEGATMHHLKNGNYLYQLSLKFLCRQQLSRQSLTINCRHFQLRSSGGIGCWDCLLKLSVEAKCWDLFRSVVEFICFYHPLRLSVEVSYWDCPWNQLSRLPVKISPWDYLLRSMFEIKIICWNQQSRSYAESCLARSAVEIRNWDYLSRSNDEVICWDLLLRWSVEINCWDCLVRPAANMIFWD